MLFKWLYLFAILALVLGCSSTKDAKRSQELLSEFSPRFSQLRSGMRREEVEAILKPKRRETGRLNISGNIISHYELAGDVRATLFFRFNVNSIEEADNSPLADDYLDARMGSVETYDGHGKWSETPLSTLIPSLRRDQ